MNMQIYDHYYGTSKDSVENLIKNDIIFDIDWQGTKQVKNKKSKLNKNISSTSK